MPSSKIVLESTANRDQDREIRFTLVGVFRGVEQSLDALEELVKPLEVSIFRTTGLLNLLGSLAGVILIER